MTGFKCKYCGKEYKTEKGLAKHHCVQMDRYNEWSDTMAYVFNIVNNYYQLCKKCEDVEEQKIVLINCRYYDLIKKLEQYLMLKILDNLTLHIMECYSQVAIAQFFCVQIFKTQ